MAKCYYLRTSLHLGSVITLGKTLYKAPELKNTLTFLKCYLEVHNKSSNVACRAELDRFPLIIDIDKRIVSHLQLSQRKG